MKRIAVISVGRSDYSLLRPLITRIGQHPELDLQLLVSGTHLEVRFGRTVELIERDGLPIAAQIPCLSAGDTPLDVASAMGRATLGFANAFEKLDPQLIVVLGDRFEMFAAASAAVPFRIPILHLHGGELTLGAIDECFRHALTKMSHLHGVASDVYRQRVIQMGEEPWRVLCCGALGLDGLRTAPELSRAQIERRFSLDLSHPPLLVTLHPTTNEYKAASQQADALLLALESLDLPVVFTMPNADTAAGEIRRRILDFCSSHPRARWVENFGPDCYAAAMRHCAAMVGNSSSALLEAPFLRLPAVNIGRRQDGRLRAGNVVDVPEFEPAAIIAAVRHCLSVEFRRAIGDSSHLLGDGHACERLLEWILHTSVDHRLLNKPFHTQLHS